MSNLHPEAFDRGSIFPAPQQLPGRRVLEREAGGISHFVMFIVCSIIFPCLQVNVNSTSSDKITRGLLFKDEKLAAILYSLIYSI